MTRMELREYTEAHEKALGLRDQARLLREWAKLPKQQDNREELLGVADRLELSARRILDEIGDSSRVEEL